MTPLVLLPGMMCDARLYGPQIDAFSAERDVIVLPITEGETVEALATRVLAQAPDRFALLGLSMGGIIAMEMMAQAPERVERLALLDTNPKAERPEHQARRIPQMAAAEAGELRRIMRDEMKPHYLAPGPGREAVLDLCMEMAEALGPEVFVRQSRALMGRPDQCDTLKGVTVPTLVLCGEADALCPLHRHELMRDLVPGSELVVVDGAGHLPVLEQPEATNAAIRHWLNRAD